MGADPSHGTGGAGRAEAVRSGCFLVRKDSDLTVKVDMGLPTGDDPREPDDPSIKHSAVC
jgi:hypothetical protein